MSKLMKKSAMAIAAVGIALPLAASPVQAKIKEVKFHVAQTQFDDVPNMVMEHDGSKYKWTNASDNFNIRIKVYFKASGKAQGAHITLTQTGASLWALPSQFRTSKYEALESTTIGKTLLSPFQNQAAALCDVFGGEQKTIRDMTPEAVMAVSQDGNVVRRKNSFPIKVVCMPKKEPARTPVEFQVTALKLYTVPAAPVCGQPVKLITEIHSNKPGKVEFTLFRKDGEQQEASLTTEKAGSGYVKRWAKTYNYDRSIRRDYMVVVRGHEFSSQWVPVEVSCGASADIERPEGLSN